jgi:hypothetical protein
LVTGRLNLARGQKGDGAVMGRVVGIAVKYLMEGRKGSQGNQKQIKGENRC